MFLSDISLKTYSVPSIIKGDTSWATDASSVVLSKAICYSYRIAYSLMAVWYSKGVESAGFGKKSKYPSGITKLYLGSSFGIVTGTFGSSFEKNDKGVKNMESITPI